MNGLKLFVCTNHGAKYPMGVASIVLAHTEFDARRLLADEIDARGLPPKQFTHKRIDTSKPQAVVLQDGDY